MTRVGRGMIAALTGVLLVFLWSGIKAFYELPSYRLPGPTEVWAAGVRERAMLTDAALSTIMGAAQGFAGAAVIGFVVALVLGSSKLARTAFYPPVLVAQMIPVVVLAPMFVIWVGPGLASVRLITFVIGCFPVVASTTHGLISTDRQMVDLFRMCNASCWQELFLLRVPAALPNFFNGLRISSSLAMIGAVTGEMFAGSSAGGTGGLGFLVIIYNSQVKIPALYATGLTACLCGFLFVALVQVVEWLVLRRWHESHTVGES